MNPISIVITMALLLLTVFAIVRAKQKAKLKNALFLQKLLDYAATLNCTVSQHDQTDNILIGFCENKNVALFLKRTDDSEITDFVALDAVKKCTLNKSIRRGANSTEAIERIAIVFTLVDEKRPSKQFELYHIDKDSLNIMSELQLAEKWRSIFSDNIPVNIIF